MTDHQGSYSDWRTIAPVGRCPQCSGTHLRSRDCPVGMEVECASGCSYREVLTDFTGKDFELWMGRMRSQGRS